MPTLAPLQSLYSQPFSFHHFQLYASIPRYSALDDFYLLISTLCSLPSAPNFSTLCLPSSSFTPAQPHFHGSCHSFEGHSRSSQPINRTALFVDTRASFPFSLGVPPHPRFGCLALALLISTEHSAPSHLWSQLCRLPASRCTFSPVRASSGLRVKAPATVRLASPRDQCATASCIGSRWCSTWCTPRASLSTLKGLVSTLELVPGGSHERGPKRCSMFATTHSATHYALTASMGPHWFATHWRPQPSSTLLPRPDYHH